VVEDQGLIDLGACGDGASRQAGDAVETQCVAIVYAFAAALVSAPGCITDAFGES